ncbi:MAG TPA: hypothetical protein PKI62_12780 [bacterium]|nr:hypothetical protein [bacterium]HPR88305.1 hypothetical protein [bacterium]
MSRWMTGAIAAVLLLGCSAPAPKQPAAAAQNWSHFVRIGGHGLSMERIPQIIRSVQETGVFGIETDNDITGRYDSFLDPTAKLAAIKKMADEAHRIGNYAFVYIAGTECITANADKTPHSFFKDHPDWVQRKRTGEPAVFGGGTAFWISAGDEDVWISPYAMEWRKIYMERVRQIAATGIDGVYVDIPYWMTHFEGWEESWASFDDYTVAAFKQQTGLDARTQIKPGDLSDPGFLKWVDFRIRTLTEFMAEINTNVKSVNPACMTIPEIYPGIGEEAVRVGSDVYEMYLQMDAIAHEYSAGGYTAAEREPLDWFTYMEGMFTFRAFAQGKASWMLSYSWDQNEGISPRDAMQNLALSQVMAGANFWDAEGHVMSGSNDFAARTEIFKWIGANEKTLYHPRQPMQPVGLYFSPQTRNYFADEFIASYHGLFHLLLNAHCEFEVVTPRTLAGFTGKVLILPDVRILSAAELTQLQQMASRGQKILLTGASGAYDSARQKLAVNPLHQLLGIDGKTGAQAGYQPECPGKAYLAQARQEGLGSLLNAGSRLQGLLADFQEQLRALGYEPAVRLETSALVAAQIARVDGQPHLFLANFTGLAGGKNANQIPVRDARVVLPATGKNQLRFLPFLGEVQTLPAQLEHGSITCTLPEFQRGAIVWIE